MESVGAFLADRFKVIAIYNRYMAQSHTGDPRFADSALPECDAFPDCPYCNSEIEKETISREGQKHKRYSCPKCRYGYIKPRA